MEDAVDVVVGEDSEWHRRVVVPSDQRQIGMYRGVASDRGVELMAQSLLSRWQGNKNPTSESHLSR